MKPLWNSKFIVTPQIIMIANVVVINIDVMYFKLIFSLYNQITVNNIRQNELIGAVIIAKPEMIPIGIDLIIESTLNSSISVNIIVIRNMAKSSGLPNGWSKDVERIIISPADNTLCVLISINLDKIIDVKSSRHISSDMAE